MTLPSCTQGKRGTCKHGAGRSNIDYIVVDTEVAQLIDNVSIALDVQLQSNVGIKFRTNRRPEHIHTMQLQRPKPIKYKTDDEGQNRPWTCTAQKWEDSLRRIEYKAKNDIRKSKEQN